MGGDGGDGGHEIGGSVGVNRIGTRPIGFRTGNHMVTPFITVLGKATGRYVFIIKTVLAPYQLGAIFPLMAQAQTFDAREQGGLDTDWVRLGCHSRGLKI